MKSLKIFIFVCLSALCLTSCGKAYAPKPYGYVRYFVPDTAYRQFDYCGVCVFDKSDNAQAEPRQQQYWVNLRYPSLNAVVHCSYYPVQGNLRMLSDDAQEFVYKHTGKANAIKERGYDDEEHRVHGVFYTLEGNTASPFQFYLTDSVRHFFRAALYFECLPNQDSLQPSIDYMQQDMIRMIESLRWK